MLFHLSFIVCLAVSVTASTPPPPNVVFALVDDLGYNGVGYNNPDVKTPTIDALAASGVVLDGFHSYKVRPCIRARGS